MDKICLINQFLPYCYFIYVNVYLEYSTKIIFIIGTTNSHLFIIVFPGIANSFVHQQIHCENMWKSFQLIVHQIYLLCKLNNDNLHLSFPVFSKITYLHLSSKQLLKLQVLPQSTNINALRIFANQQEMKMQNVWKFKAS